MTDACGNGIGGVVAQGSSWKKAKVAAFYSEKMSSAQKNYPVHEQKMLAGVETMLRHRDILQGIHFVWVTDHKGLIHLLDQKGLSGRQARWLEQLSEFDFEILYVPGEENILPDALSRLYEYDAPGTIRAPEEHLQCDLDIGNALCVAANTVISAPSLVGSEAAASTTTLARRSRHIAEQGPALGTMDPPRKRRGPKPKALTTDMTPESAGPSGRVEPSLVDSSPGAGPSTMTDVPSAVTSSIPTEHSPALNGQAPAVQRRRGPRPVVPPAETGRPETGAEFAARIKDRFVLRGPRRTEGGMGTTTQTNPTPEQSTISDNNQTTEETHVVNDARHGWVDRNPPPVVYPMEEGMLLEIKGRYKEDAFFQKIVEMPRAFKNFDLTFDGFIRLKLHDQDVLCIPDVKVGEWKLHEMVIDQAHSLLAHLGTRKTLSYLREYVWWDTIVRDVNAFCISCVTCQRSKPPNQKTYGLLNPLPVPSAPWDAIGVDFVGPLPESKNRDGNFDSIPVEIDLLSAMIHLVPSRINYTARDIVELMFSEVYKHHGLPRSIVSDRDVLFTSQFWTHLNKLIGVKQRMTSAYHPETDGSTKRANRTIGQILRSCVGPNQKDWVAKLPMIEFAINLARSKSTGYSPFFLNSG